ncbi:phosphodiester glycosidase family protein [Saccharibacillus alkalitolerans]|uniref:phosphodiester glycosidase family protein n=1 Tax=Saccharibacillus alkalitolerans TaxID=2705290 RepID=UPI002E2CED89|nr:phosphodiester glycosidase family protein [Saccharibacillus alkalitolerans]
MRRKWWGIKILLAAVLLVSIVQPGLTAGAALAELPAVQYGRAVDIRQTELAPGATYTRMDLEDARGPQKVHSVEFNPAAAGLELKAGTKDGKVYGMKGVTEMAAYADAPGSRVIAGINGDFYDISGSGTGVPNGLFMNEGRILNSGSGYAFGLTRDGRSLYGTPQLTKKLTIGGTSVDLHAVNRYRGENQLVLYTPDYYASTKSGSGGDEFVLTVSEGEVRSGSVMKLKVAEVRAGMGDSPLAEGTVVLSASGTAKERTQGLKVGDELTAEFSLAGEWSEAVLAIGGQGPLIKDGVVQSGVRPEGVHPRTAVGTKADGSLILLEVDGRAPGFSEGVETQELGQILKDRGAVDAINLDGGGSSTFAARMPGTSSVKMLNRGSDGYERKTGNGLLLVNTAPELSSASSLVVQPDGERILQGSTYPFKAAAIDANGHPAVMEGTPVWQVPETLGTIDASGVFKAAADANGTGSVQVEAGGVKGAAGIEVVGDLTELVFPDSARTYAAGETARLSVTALRGKQTVQADNASFRWRTEGDIGTVDANGVFTAGERSDAKGRIFAGYGNVETSFEVSVGIPPVMLEDFESGLGKYRAASVLANSVAITEETNPDYVRGGSRALKLEYDFTGKTGTSGAYLQATSAENRIQIPGYPAKIGMWVYGDGQKHWLRGQLKDGNDAAVPINFTEQTTGVDWTGWKYVESDVPQGKVLPLTMDMPVRYMETNNAKKTAGALYIDNIRAVYGPLEEDRTPPVIKELIPSSGQIVETATPELSVIAEDDGYDPAANPGTTLIDPDSIRMYVDGQPVEHSLYPPKGRIAYKPASPLTEGRHTAKIAVRDLAGNQTIREWSFSVNLGSPYYVYDTPERLETGGSYTLDIRAAKASILRSGELAFRFDPAAASGLEVIAGGKIGGASQVRSQIDEAAGIVSLQFENIDQASLSDDDLLAQIRYKVRSDLIGPLTTEEAADGGTKPFGIAYRSGSVTSAEGDGRKVEFAGPDLESAARSGLKLLWDPYAVGMGFESSFTIVHAADGTPAAEAGLLLNGMRVAEGQSDASGLLRTAEVTKTAGTFTLQAVQGERYSPVMKFTVAPHAGGPQPSNVNVTMGEDAYSSRQFNWQTSPAVSDTVVELVKRSEFAGFDQANVVRITGGSSLYTTNNDGSLNVHKARAAGLEPDTEYMYRVGDGADHMSAPAAFRTSPPAGGRNVKFLFIGDSQAETRSGFALWGETLAAGLEYMPDADMIVHAGDMVDKGFEQEQWNWWFEAAGAALANRTLVPIIGNHEVMGSNGAGDYLAQFNNPPNGASGALGTSYSFDAGDAHFAVFDTEQGEQGYAAQAEWLEQDLAKSGKKWKIVFFHQGPYGSIYSNERVQAKWVPILDRYGVDLVMNGHDHIYMRSFPMKNGEIAPEGEGTRYLIGGSSGPKFYALTKRFWQEKIDDSDAQIYTGVEVSEKAIEISVRKLDGTEIDRLTIGETSAEDALKGIEFGGKTMLKPGDTDRTVTEAVYASGRSVPLAEGVTYRSSDTAVAEIGSDGEVRALGEGETVLSAAYAGFTDSYTLKVTNEEPQMVGIRLEGPVRLEAGSEGVTVVSAVYGDGTRIPIPADVRFASSDPNVAAIDESGRIRALQPGETEIGASYGPYSDTYTLGVYAAPSQPGPGPLPEPQPEPIPQPSPNPAPIPAPGSAQPPASSPAEGAGASVPDLPAGTGGPGDRVVSAAELAPPAGGRPVTVAIAGSTERIVLPANAGELLGTSALRLESAAFRAELPAALLNQAAERLPGTDSEAAALVLKVTEADGETLLASARSTTGANIRLAGRAFDWTLAALDASGKEYEVEGAFAEPLNTAMTAEQETERQLTGLYRIASDGSLEYVGGLWNGRELNAALTSNGTYAILAYDKTFGDLAEGHWAETAVKILSARQLITGTSADTFEPSREITRAEFAAMLTRALKLEASAASGFGDVPAGSWYAEAAAAARQAGIVQGGRDGRFEPNRAVSRAEMAAMLMRAYAYAGGKMPDASGASASADRFADLAGAPGWQREAALGAAELGLMRGQGAKRFVPESPGTRAESAQMILNLLRSPAESFARNGL